MGSSGWNRRRARLAHFRNQRQGRQRRGGDVPCAGREAASSEFRMNLLAALGYAVFERASDRSFQLAGPAPDWLSRGCLTEVFPFLEVFLPDAEEFWANPGGRPTLHSDLWTQNELHFCAIAVPGEPKFLLIECAEQRFQQTR